MQWPSRNVSHGGILHPAKATYSPETQQFLRLLMEESKLSMTQRKKMDYVLRSGRPLPPPAFSRSESDLTAKRKPPPISIRARSSRRRPREAILQSGAYERERFVPRHPVTDREKEKKRLQNKMAFGDDAKPKSKKKSPPKQPDLNRFDQLVFEIKEREEWLKQMEDLGEAKKHEQVIQQQIQARVREMQRLSLEEKS